MKTKKMIRPAGVICLVIVFVAFSSFAVSFNFTGKSLLIKENTAINFPAVKDSIGSQKAFLAAYKVLMSPRCMNCHPKGDVPLQGDDSHLHTQGVKRGIDGKGVYALKCANCHQPENSAGTNMPPGNPKWHLPPANMKMVFEGKSPKALAAQLKDPKRNGNKTMVQLIDHVTNDKLVLAGWNPGEGRTLPPLPHAEFAKKFKEWIDKGAYLPSK
jgi:mono/diheme cytochrome c family protein